MFKPLNDLHEALVKWFDRIHYQVWMGNGVGGPGEVKTTIFLEPVPICLVMGRKPEDLASRDPLTQEPFIRTGACNEHKERIGFYCDRLSAFISHLAYEWTVTNHRKLLQELTTRNIKHDIIGEATCSWCLVLKEIPRIILVNERPPKLLDSAHARWYSFHFRVALSGQ